MRNEKRLGANNHLAEPYKTLSRMEAGLKSALRERAEALRIEFGATPREKT